MLRSLLAPPPIAASWRLEGIDAIVEHVEEHAHTLYESIANPVFGLRAGETQRRARERPATIDAYLDR